MDFDATFIYNLQNECIKYHSTMHGKQSGKHIYDKLSKPLVLEVLLSREDEPT